MKFPRRQVRSQWRAQLSPEQFAVCRQKATERPFTGRYNEHSAAGTYRCVCCGQPYSRAAASSTPAAAGRASRCRSTRRRSLRRPTAATAWCAPRSCARTAARLGHVRRRSRTGRIAVLHQFGVAGFRGCRKKADAARARQALAPAVRHRPGPVVRPATAAGATHAAQRIPSFIRLPVHWGDQDASWPRQRAVLPLSRKCPGRLRRETVFGLPVRADGGRDPRRPAVRVPQPARIPGHGRGRHPHRPARAQQPSTCMRRSGARGGGPAATSRSVIVWFDFRAQKPARCPDSCANACAPGKP